MLPTGVLEVLRDRRNRKGDVRARPHRRVHQGSDRRTVRNVRHCALCPRERLRTLRLQQRRAGINRNRRRLQIGEIEPREDGIDIGGLGEGSGASLEIAIDLDPEEPFARPKVCHFVFPVDFNLEFVD